MEFRKINPEEIDCHSTPNPQFCQCNGRYYCHYEKNDRNNDQSFEKRDRDREHPEKDIILDRKNQVAQEAKGNDTT